jgi:hypothetical protein
VGTVSFVKDNGNQHNHYPQALVIPNSAKHILMFNIGGDNIEELEGMTTDELKADLLAHLQMFVSGTINIQEIALTHWH